MAFLPFCFLFYFVFLFLCVCASVCDTVNQQAFREPAGLLHKNQQVFIVMNPIDLNLEPPILAVSNAPFGFLICRRLNKKQPPGST